MFVLHLLFFNGSAVSTNCLAANAPPMSEFPVPSPYSRDGLRFIVLANERSTAFLELEQVTGVALSQKGDSPRLFMHMKPWEIIADNLSKAGWSWGCVSAIDSNGRTIWIVANDV